MEEIYALSAPSCNISLTPIDQTAAKLYSRRILCFSLPSSGHENAVRVLRIAMQATVNRIPSLAMQAAPAPLGTQLGSSQLLPGGKAYLIVKDLSHKLDYKQLKACNFSTNLLDPLDLCPVPPYKEVTDPMDLCKIQVNLIKDGILLLFGIHHLIADGTAMSTIIRVLASECRVAQSLAPSFEFPAAANDRSPLLKGTEGTPDPSLLVGYTVHDSIPPLPTWALPDGRPVATVLFHISSASMAALKAAASFLPSTNAYDAPSVPYITSHDAVSALFWSGIFCARRKLGYFGDDDGTDDTKATLAMPVDIRGIASPALLSTFIGNALIQTCATVPLSSLTSPSRLALAARSIRAALLAVSAERIHTITSISASIPQVKHLEISCARDIWHSDFYMTSMRKFEPHKLDWGPALGEFEAFKLPKGGLGAGCGVVMPAERDGGWAVSLSMHEEVMKLFREDELVKEYTVVAEAA